MRRKILFNFIIILIISSSLTGYIAYSIIKSDHLNSKEEKYISSINLIKDSIIDDSSSFSNLNFFDKAQKYSNLTLSRVTFIGIDGIPIADSHNNSIIFDNLSFSLGINNAINNQSKVFYEYSKEMGGKYYYYADMLEFQDNESIIIRIGESVDNTDKLVEKLLTYLLFSILSSIVIAIIISFGTIENLVKPLKELSEASKFVAAGDFSHTIDINSDDEIGELTASFNSMILELNEYIKSINEVERMRKDFVSNVSHELKTPLTSILGFIETLRIEGIGNEIRIKALDIIETESLRLEEMIEKLLVLSKIESRDDNKDLVKVDISRVIKDVLEVLTPQIKEKNIEVSLDIGFLDATIKGNEFLLKSVMMNLIENSIKFNRDNGKVEISILEYDNSFGVVVKDNGIGIPSDKLDKIFERFYRVDNIRNITKGSGLGLAITKHIVMGLDGTIEVESSTKTGSVFKLEFPKA